MKKILIGLLLSSSFSSLIAENLDFRGMTASDAKGTIQNIHIFDSVLTFPYPDWFKTGLVGDIYKKQDGPTFIYEQVPVNETLNNWQEMFAVSAIKHDSPKFNMAAFIDTTFKPYEESCGTEDFVAEPLMQKTDDEMYIIFCSDTNNSVNTTESDTSYGEVAIFRFIKHHDTYIKIYQEWKIPAFDLNSPNGITGIDSKTIDTAINEILEDTYISSHDIMK
jgi:hypothetical protein